jgi:hypothetical protein
MRKFRKATGPPELYDQNATCDVPWRRGTNATVSSGDRGKTFQHPALLRTSITSAGLYPSSTAIDLIGLLRCVNFRGFARAADEGSDGGERVQSANIPISEIE